MLYTDRYVTTPPKKWDNIKLISKRDNLLNKRATYGMVENLQIMYLISGQYPEYVRNSYKSTAKKTQMIQFKNGQRTLIVIFPKKTYKWPMYMKRSLISLNIREMQIKTTMRYHLRDVRMNIITNTRDTCWWASGEKGSFVHCWWECTLAWLLWKYKSIPYFLYPFIPLMGTKVAFMSWLV